ERLTGRSAITADLDRARQLFARAVETPGGLKLQTIHAFAERLLHLFPFEANVPARFSVLDDLTRLELIDAAKRATLAEALSDASSALGIALRSLSADVGEDGLDALINESLPLYAGQDVKGLAPAERRRLIAAALGMDGADTPDRQRDDLLALPFGPGAWKAAADAIAAGSKSKTDHESATMLLLAHRSGQPERQVEAMRRLFLTEKETLRAHPLTKKFLEGEPGIAEAIAATKEPILAILERRRAFDALLRSDALMALLDAVHTRYRLTKIARSVVDFDDIIDKTRRLVRDEGAAWVLRKLDGGIDHVLLDEAQDTTPAMWEILASLTAEFFAGQGARALRRSIFAVGDEKQSIYSFQGARPKELAERRSAFRARAEAAEVPFLARELKLSFRTVADVLNAVDRIFDHPAHRRGLTADETAPVHETARHGAPGVVELWPLEIQPKSEPREAWEEVDAVGRHSAQVLLARRIAGHVASLIRSGCHASDGKRITAGDILILVQTRDAFFEAVIRALKRAQVPVAGADRLKLTEEQAVLDLVAAARVALLPEDDLALATVLKSPLIGLTDEDLIALAPEREGSLFAALAASPEGRHRNAHATIARWQGLAQRTTPYGFFATLLGPEGGRKRLIGRLGIDATDGIDLYLQAVQQREASEPPSLLREVEAFEALTMPMKRDQEQGGDVVRVMTVHGAKGLEARIVYLPDATRLPRANADGSLFLVTAPDEPDHPVLISAGRKTDTPAAIATLRDERRALREDEYRRLFYVAMTRARDRLILAGWSRTGDVPEGSWYAMAEASLAPASVPAEDADAGLTVLRFQIVEAPAAINSAPPVAPAPPTPLPGWLNDPLPDLATAAVVLRPSHAVTKADQAVSEERAQARRRGDALHDLIERLPQVPKVERLKAGRAALSTRWPGITEADSLVDEALALLSHQEAEALFGPGSLAEVAVAGEISLPDGRTHAISGRIDRLLVTPDSITVADFKTGVPPRGAASPAHAVQLALYARLLAGLFPGRPVTALLIYTRTGSVVQLPATVLEDALKLL
ncbi:MAG: double-strand break repair helicase AddA, partial [Proteobacteria bacterium]|nr:double-strand break repair helicase AddA [Pseudomonadota bacterium]